MTATGFGKLRWFHMFMKSARTWNCAVLAKLDGLRQAEVPLLEARAAECVAAQIATTRHRIRKNSVRTERRRNNSCTIYGNIEGTQPTTKVLLYRTAVRSDCNSA